MEKNVGGTERWVRWGVGAGLVALGLRSKGWRRWLAMSAGSSLIGSASIQKCAVNKLLGINTCASADEKLLATDKSLVEETSEESFPASDPPAWTTGR